MPGTIPHCSPYHSDSSDSSPDSSPVGGKPILVDACCGDTGGKHDHDHDHNHGKRSDDHTHKKGKHHDKGMPAFPGFGHGFDFGKGHGNMHHPHAPAHQHDTHHGAAPLNPHNMHNGCEPASAPTRPRSCAPYPQAYHPQVYHPAAVVPPAPACAPFTYNSSAPSECQPHVCGPHAACAPQPCGPAHAHVHPNGNCHDVSLLLSHMNALCLPPIKYACAPHPPLGVCVPNDNNTAMARVPAPFCFDARLARDELHHPLLCYLAEGVAPSVFTTGLAGTKVQTAHRLLADERPDGYRALQCLVYAHVLLSLNVLLLEDAPRNVCLDGRRLWTVTSPCAAATSAVASGLELHVAGKPAVALEVHPSNVVTNCLMDAILNTIKCGAFFDCARGRVVSDPHGDPLLYADALSVLTQVWCRFAKDMHRKDTPIKWVVLSNLERTIVFHRRAQQIGVSHIIRADGASNPRDSCKNLYSTLLALSVLEKHKYQSSGGGLIELVQLL